MWGHQTSTFPWGVHTRLQQGTINLRPQEKGLALCVQIFGRASIPLLRASEVMALDEL